MLNTDEMTLMVLFFLLNLSIIFSTFCIKENIDLENDIIDGTTIQLDGNIYKCNSAKLDWSKQ